MRTRYPIKKILIVDDDRIFAMQIKQQLKHMGNVSPDCEFTLVGSMVEGKALIEGGYLPDLYVQDGTLPDGIASDMFELIAKYELNDKTVVCTSEPSRWQPICQPVGIMVVEKHPTDSALACFPVESIQ